MQKRSGKKKGPTGPSSEDMAWNIQVQEKENFLMGYLSPIESSVMTFQNVLVWENPQHSAILFVVVHILFWLATTVRVYYVIGLIGTIIVAVDMWKNHIWPEIRVPQSPGGDQEDWIPVHPKLLSVPEMCQWLARGWVYIADTVQAAASLRRRNHPKFFLYAIICLSCTGVVGCYVPGLLMAYVTVLFCLLWPCLLYHDGLHHVKEFMQPILANLEAKLNIKRKRKGTSKGKQRHGATPSPRIDISDSDSEELQEFVPPTADPKIEMTLAKADSDSEEDEEGLTHGLLTPPHIPSQNPSREHSDVEDSMAASTDDLGSLVSDMKSIPAHDDEHDDFGSLASGLIDIPSYDDTLDGTTRHEEDIQPDLSKEEESLLEQEVDEVITEEMQIPDTQPDQEAIEFVSSHFSQFSEEDDSGPEQTVPSVNEDIISELSNNLSGFPDVEEDSSEPTPTQAMLASGLHMLTSQGQALVSQGQALVSAIGTTNVSGLMASTVAGLSTLRETVTSVVHQDHATSAGGGDAEMSDSVDSRQLEAEFEFLNEEELAQEDLDGTNDTITGTD